MCNLHPIDLSYINASWLPVSHIPINYARLEVARANYPNNQFIAAFYKDGQIAHFTYYIDGNWRECIHLDLTHRRKTGRIGEIDRNLPECGWMGIRYSHEGEVEDDNAWSEGIPGRPIDFHQWVEESIADIVWFGIDHQVVGLGKAAQEVVTRTIGNFLYTHSSRADCLKGYPTSSLFKEMAMARAADRVAIEALRVAIEEFNELKVNISRKRTELLEFITFEFGE